MGIGETLKDYYYKTEDSWYKFVDNVSQKLPVFGNVVDKIEEKGIPTFPVAIAIVLILLILILFLLFGTASSLVVVVKDEAGNPVSGAQVTVFLNGVQEDYFETGADGRVVFYLENNTYSIKVDKQGFASVTRSDITTGETTITLVSQTSPVTKSVALKNASGQLITGTGTVVYSCVGSNEQRYSNYQNGRFNVDFSDCTEIQIDSISGYTIIEGRASFSSADDIIVNKLEQNTGTITVQLSTANENLPTGLRVMLYNKNELLVKTTYSNSNIVVFSDVITDSYYIVVADPNGDFSDYDGSSIGETKELRKDESLSFNVVLNRSVSASITVTVKDAQTGLPISGAEVKRKSIQNQNDLDTLITGNSGQVTFLVASGSNYLISAEHPNYIIDEPRSVAPNENITFNLVEANESNSQSLIVRVKDPRGDAISGTRVVLKKTDDTKVDEKITGHNGEVEFYNLEFGNYFVTAVKPGFATVTSPSTQVLPRRVNAIDVTIDIGTGIIRLNVSDESGVLPSANVTAVNITGAIERETSTNQEGSADFSIRVDKEVYFIVETPGKASYYTTSMMADSGALTEKDIILRDTTGGLNVTLAGIFSNGEELSGETINSGSYTAKLLLEVPRGNFNEAGVHIRTGKAENEITNLMEEDSIAIGKISASTTKTTKGKTYSPINGYNIDSKNLTSSTAKWANVIWNNPVNAVYEIEAEILVTDSLTTSAENFWYRAWAKGSSNLKDPQSSVAGHELYSNAKNRLFSINNSVGTNLCNASFCKIYTLETLTGRNAGRVQAVNNSVSVAQSNTYILKVDLINLKPISGAVIEIEGRGISIDEIKLNSNIENDTIILGGLSTDTYNRIEIKFTANNAGSGAINLKVNSGSKTELDQTITITTTANKKFNLDILPRQLIPYINNTLFFEVTDNNNPLSKTIIEIIEDNITLGIVETSGDGIATFELPSPSAGDTITIIAKKEGYDTINITKTVDERLILITPPEIVETIKIGEIVSINQTLILTNQTVKDIKLTRVTTTGELATYLNIDLDGIAGSVVASGQDSNYSIKFRTNSVSQRLREPISVTGTINFETEIDGTNQKFESKLPVNIRLSMPGYLDSDRCLKIIPGTIEFNTSTNEATQNIEIENNCVAEGTKINLFELEAKLNSASKLGTIMVSGTGFMNASLSETYSKIAEILEKDAKQTLTVRFVPSASVSSGEEELKVTIRAKNIIDSSDSETIEASFNTRISMSNLARCIEVVKPETGLVLEVAGWNLGYDRLVTSNIGSHMSQYQGFNSRSGLSAPFGFNQAIPFTGQQQSNIHEQDRFVIKNNCAVDIEIDLDPDSRLSVSEETFVIGRDSDATITVSPGYTLGKYNIGVNAKLANSNDTKRKIDSVSVTVRKLGEMDAECIKVNVTTLNFNSFLYKAEKHKVFNYCYDSGVALDRSNAAVTVQCEAPNALTTGIPYFQTGAEFGQLYGQQYPIMGQANPLGGTFNSYHDYLRPIGTDIVNSCPMVAGTRVYDRRIVEQGSGTVEELTFEVLPSAQYLPQRKLFNSQQQSFGIFNSIVDIRQWATETDARTNIYGNLSVRYTNQYGSMQTMSFPIKIEDIWRVGESIDSAVNWGDPSARPEQCVDEDRTNNSLNIRAYWENKGNTRGAIPDAEYKNSTVYNYIAQPPAVRIGPASQTSLMVNPYNRAQPSQSGAANCGLLDNISNISYERNFGGVIINIDDVKKGSIINNTLGPNLVVTINRSGIQQNCVYIDTVVTADLTRAINLQKGQVKWNLKAIVTRPGYNLLTDRPEIECSVANIDCDAIVRSVIAQNPTKTSAEILALVLAQSQTCVNYVNETLINNIKNEQASQEYKGTCEINPNEFGFDKINKTSLSEITSNLNDYCDDNYCSTEMFTGYIYDKYSKLKASAANQTWKTETSGILSELYKEAKNDIKIDNINYYATASGSLITKSYMIPDSYFSAGQKETITSNLTTGHQAALSTMNAVLDKVKSADTKKEIFLEVKNSPEAIGGLGVKVGNNLYISVDTYIKINQEVITQLNNGTTSPTTITVNSVTINATQMKHIAENSKLVELINANELAQNDTEKINRIYDAYPVFRTMKETANKQSVYVTALGDLALPSGFSNPSIAGFDDFSETKEGFSGAGKYTLQIELNYKKLAENNLEVKLIFSNKEANEKISENILLTNDFKFNNASGVTNVIASNAGLYNNIPAKITAVIAAQQNSLTYNFDGLTANNEIINWTYNGQKLSESGTNTKTINIPSAASAKTLTGTYFHPKDQALIINPTNVGNASVSVTALIVSNETKQSSTTTSSVASIQFTTTPNMTLTKVVELVKADNACVKANEIVWNNSKIK